MNAPSPNADIHRHPIAAAFAWLIAAVLSLIGIVYLSGVTLSDYADPNFWYVAVCMIPILFSASFLNTVAGLLWLNGSPRPAFVLQIVGGVILFGGSALVTRFVIA
ncbi:hypothetical protein Poly51_50220 [Rubripirellula tenax]|uniref:Uncharacterized protein n=1 Tax=Rubripirellula tenax TaxID=2528015 RepID=A0A5C6EBR3_9BACT|nr:hypothetical protein [Rubripirellula tenax]TWU47223.1 hypothetical protein Poly51_50220 [Rubripirellula tenax]